MNLAVRIKLSVMMFLQYAVWSIWAVMLLVHLQKLGISDISIGIIMACGGIGSIIGPLILGQLADRYFATEKVLAFCHLAGGALLILAAYFQSFWPILVVMLLYCTLYFPTLGLTNSLTFRTLGNEHAQLFAPIRLWGTIGWLVATFLTGRYLNLSSETVPQLAGFFKMAGEPSLRDVLRIPGFVSLFYGLYCFFLPHTPPTPATGQSGPRQSAFLESLQLMKDRSFAVLIFVSGLLGFALYYYFQCEQAFLPSVGIRETNVGSFIILGQVGEIVSMAMVPFMILRLGVKRTMLLGASAYAALFGLNMLGQPWALVAGANLLHGFCFGFFFVVAQIFVDKAAPDDIKASAQSLFVFVVYGLFNVVGNVGAGAIRDALLPNWLGIWGVPFGVTLLAILIFATLFHERKIARTTIPQD